MVEPNYSCTDCGKNTLANSYYDLYMVSDSLWRKFGSKKDYLCIHCLQLRVGRDLTTDDFQEEHPLNKSNRFIKALKR